MIKNFFVVITLFVLTYSYAQEGSTSPYSFYGIGELKFGGTVENQSMGGISVYTDSIHLNLRNPAAFSELFVTTFSVGASHNSTQYKNATKTETKNNASLDYLVLAFPLAKKLGFGFGLLPYTAVGYNVRSTSSNNSQQQEFKGDGGVNKVFLSLGYKINNNFSIGVTGNYGFGKLDNQSELVISDVAYGTREVNTSELSGIDFNIGLTYKTKIMNKLTFRSSLAFAPEAKLSSINYREISTFSDFSSVLGDTEVIDLKAQGLKYTDLVLPSSLSLGAGIGKEQKWFVGTEIQSIKTSNFENSFLNISGVEYEDSYRFSLGGFYIPKYNSFTSYLSRVVYRAGFKFEETGLIINNQKINNFGISFGLGLPVSGASNVNLNFEYGKRGTLNAGLIEENYFNAKLSLSLNERWFVKRKYN